MFGNEFARALMNTHAVQKNKGESGDDTMRGMVCVGLFFFAANTWMQRVSPRGELKVAKTSEILAGLSFHNEPGNFSDVPTDCSLTYL